MESRDDFDGETFEPERDGPRLTKALECVLWVLCDGKWHSLQEIQDQIIEEFGKQFSQAGISARIRDLRKDRFGGFDVEHIHIKGGLWRYRLND